MSRLVNYEFESGVAKIRFDDGKVNIMSLDMLKALHEAFDRAARDSAIIVLTGRDGIFSAGFDTKILASNNAEMSFSMLRSGAELALRVLEYPFPVIAACNGHALPMGAFLMLTSDIRIGTEGPFRIGLNEVLIGLTLPHFAIEIARQRLTTPYFNRIVTGELLAPPEAVTAGYLDMLTEAQDLLPRATAMAHAYRGIDLTHFTASKARVRAPAIAAIRTAIDSEITLDSYKRRFART